MDVKDATYHTKIDPSGILISGTAGNEIILDGEQGRVGIGTNAPDDKLEVVGAIRICSTLPAYSSRYTQFGGPAEYEPWHWDTHGVGCYINHYSGQNVYLCSSGAGKVGIGSDQAPSYKFQVGNAASNENQIYIAPSAYTGGKGILIGGWEPSTSWDSSARIQCSDSFHIDSQHNKNMFLNHYSNGDLIIGYGGGDMHIYNQLKVGYASSSHTSSHALDVYGSIDCGHLTCASINTQGNLIQTGTGDIELSSGSSTGGRAYFRRTSGVNDVYAIRIGGGQAPGGVASILNTTNLHIDSNNTGHLYLNHYSNKNVSVKGSWFSSDRRIKKDIELVDDAQALNQVLALETVKYNYRERDSEHKIIGFIAQDVKKVLPEAVWSGYGYSCEMMKEVEFTYEEIIDVSGDAIDVSGDAIISKNTSPKDTTKRHKLTIINWPDAKNGQEYRLTYNNINTELKYQDGGFIVDGWEFVINKLTIVGEVVDDFLRINKDMIFALHHSAIQELSRRNDTLVAENALLKTRMETLEAAVIVLQNK